MEIVVLSQALDESGFLHESTWLSILRLAFAAMCLVVFVNEAGTGPFVEETAASAEKAMLLLRETGKINPTAQHCYEILDV